MVEYKMYEDEMVRVIQRLKPQMVREDIRKAVQYSINKRYKENKCKLKWTI